MPKTTSSSSDRLSGRFWRLLGASTEKNQGRSLSQVTSSAEYDEKAAGLDDEQLRKAAGLLDLDDLATRLDPPAPAPVVLSGSAMRVTVQVSKINPAGATLAADVTTGSSRSTWVPCPRTARPP